MSSRLLLVNFHYIRDPKQYQHPGIYPVDLPDFRALMEKLQQHLHFATPQEAEDFLLQKQPLPRPSVLMTFDDGLVDHYQTATDILDPMGVKGLFFTCTRPLTEKKALMVHKVHWLRATTEPNEFKRLFLAALPQEWQSYELSESERANARKSYIYDTPEHGNLKFFINFILPENAVDEATSRMFTSKNLTEVEFCEQNYMSPENLRSLEQNGHMVACHTHDHRPVTSLSAEEEPLMNFHIATLENILGHRPKWLSYPFGRGKALPEDPEGFCKKYDLDIGCALTNTWVDPEEAPYTVNRINVNEVEQELRNFLKEQVLI